MTETPRVDELDQAVISRLKRNASATNRALAEALGVTEQTIAARIRRLEQANLLRVVGVIDAKAAGYGLFVIVGIQVAGRKPAEVAAEVARFSNVTGINACLGGFELMASLYARDEHDLFSLLEERIGAVRGVEELESFLVLERVHHRMDWAKLDRFSDRALPDHVSEGIDALDRGILELLQVDARTSLREIGRRVGRSEGTIRSRLRRFEESGICRIQAVSDVTIGPGGAAAWIAIKARRGHVRRVAEEIARAPEAGFVGVTLGRFDVIALVSAPSREQLSKLMFERIALLPGVQRIEAWESLQVHKHDFRIVDLSVASGGPRRPRLRKRRESGRR
ncbi:MAG: Lrp/AsnC family transcriptional regulator [Deltaproteobacteria bacterium]|nr:Lrp/AsnC family transcriptional regulator [Deltaproteobacteria bacterium]